MKIPLSRSAQTLLIRIFFIVLAVGAVYGLWDNRMFLIRFPFHLLALIEIAFAAYFVYAAYNFARLSRTYMRYTQYALGGYWIYSILFNLGGSALYVFQIGIGNAAQAAGFSVPIYIAWEVTYLAIFPSLAFGFVYYLLTHR